MKKKEGDIDKHNCREKKGSTQTKNEDRKTELEE